MHASRLPRGTQVHDWQHHDVLPAGLFDWVTLALGRLGAAGPSHPV